MKAFGQIHAAYLAADGFLSLGESNATTPKERTRWAEKRRINDQAYFVMLFAQLETFINAQCEKLVDRKKKAKNWEDRRLWDSTDLDRTAFMRKVALLVEKGRTEYNDINRYYDVRCQIAHGDIAAVGPIALPIVIRDPQAIAAHVK